MIVVYPLLIDDSISKNIIPGICKSLERFILIYQMDEVSKVIGSKILTIGGSLAATAFDVKRMVAKTKTSESKLLEDMADKKRLSNTEKDYWSDKNKREQEKHNQEVEKGKMDFNKNLVTTATDLMRNVKDLRTTQFNFAKESPTISLEPTWVNVTTGTGSKIIGIKVIPFPVKKESNSSLASLLTAESSLSFFHTLIFSAARKVIRMFWALCRGIRILPFLSDRTLTGNPEKDILWASTYHKRNVYCLINFSDIVNDEFFKNAGGIHKLHKVGWNSFLAADDVNKRILFCMKEFHGLCHEVPYSFVYSSLGSEHHKVYNDLEDIKKAASPFFKTGVPVEKLMGESSILENYLEKL